MSTEANIVERLRGSLPDRVSDVSRQIAAEAAADYNDEQHNPDYYLARWFDTLLLENAKLRAERDAACVVDGTSYQKGLEMAAAVCDLPCRSLAGEMEAADPMHARMIRSLSATFGADFSEDGPNDTPAVMATSGKDAT